METSVHPVRLKKGDKLWVRDPERCWVQATLVGRDKSKQASEEGRLLVRVDQGQGDEEGQEPITKSVHPLNDCEARLVEDCLSLGSIDDLTLLMALHEPALLSALCERFARDSIYTWSGKVLLAVNPYKRIKGLYGAGVARSYLNESEANRLDTSDGRKRMPPHVYAVTRRAFKDMMEARGTNQTVLVSGESGAGKTETTKILMQGLAHMSHAWSGSAGSAWSSDGSSSSSSSSSSSNSCSSPSILSSSTKGKNKVKKSVSFATNLTNSGGAVSERVLQSNPVLEIFGNAGTCRNDNSSRFGKLIEIQFSGAGGALRGARISCFLLEKSRLVQQGNGERNYHLFYAMAAGASPAQGKAWQLDWASLGKFTYLSDHVAASRHAARREEDSARFTSAVAAMKVLGFATQEVTDIFRTAAGILHLGNVNFVAAEGQDASVATIAADEQSMHACATTCALLQVDADALERCLCKRVIRVTSSNANKRDSGGFGGQPIPAFAQRDDEAFEKPLSCEQAVLARDALAMALYERLFGWLVWRVNCSITSLDQHVGSDDAAAQPSVPEQRNRSQSPQARRNMQERSSQSLSPKGRPMSFPARGGQTIPGAIGSTSTPHQLHLGQEEQDEDLYGKCRTLRRTYQVGILDAFGFEVFESNGFEQLCINYCNERLQQLFNEYVLAREQIEYEREGVAWTFIEYPDNQPCLDMFESRPLGLFALLDENCLYPGATDLSLCHKLYSNLPKLFAHFLQPTQKQKADLRFAVRHFAADVVYDAQGFSRKNKNDLRQEAVDLVNSSHNPLVKGLFPSDAQTVMVASAQDMAAYFDSAFGDRRNSAAATVNKKQHRNKGAHKTVAGNFKTQLLGALADIRASKTHYVRCFKPNDQDESGRVDRVRLVEQLRYSGVMQIVEVARAGYPGRHLFKEFVRRYAVLCDKGKCIPFSVSRLLDSGLISDKEIRKMCLDIVNKVGLSVLSLDKTKKKRRIKSGIDVQLGLTKVFLRAPAVRACEMAKEARLLHCAKTIQRGFRQYKALQFLKANATKIQSLARALSARAKFSLLLEAKREQDQREQDAARVIQISVLSWIYLRKKRIAKEEKRKEREMRRQEREQKEKERQEKEKLEDQQKQQQQLAKEKGRKQQQQQQEQQEKQVQQEQQQELRQSKNSPPQDEKQMSKNKNPQSIQDAKRSRPPPDGNEIKRVKWNLEHVRIHAPIITSAIQFDESTLKDPPSPSIYRKDNEASFAPGGMVINKKPDKHGTEDKNETQHDSDSDTSDSDKEANSDSDQGDNDDEGEDLVGSAKTKISAGLLHLIKIFSDGVPGHEITQSKPGFVGAIAVVLFVIFFGGGLLVFLAIAGLFSFAIYASFKSKSNAWPNSNTELKSANKSGKPPKKSTRDSKRSIDTHKAGKKKRNK